MRRHPFPLQWPEGWSRTARRRPSQFNTGFATARDALFHELVLLGGVANAVITSDMPLRLDGLPHATGSCADPGIAVYWMKDGAEQVMACDRWLTPAENLQAVRKSIEAIRGLGRWGASDLVRRAFSGFTALPPGSSGTIDSAPVVRSWREVLGGFPTELGRDDLLALAKARHRKLIKDAHPDAGGDAAVAAELNAAIESAERELAP